jgi:hypothetical protein
MRSFNYALHLAVDRAEAALPLLQHFLRERNITINEISTISPSIEDVFVALSKQPSSTLSHNKNTVC